MAIQLRVPYIQLRNFKGKHGFMKKGRPCQPLNKIFRPKPLKTFSSPTEEDLLQQITHCLVKCLTVREQGALIDNKTAKTACS